MALSPIVSAPRHTSYDVVIIGGAMLGSASAWFLSDNKSFGGRVLVVEMDPTYRNAASSHTNSCIRQQFSSAINVRISQFGAHFIKTFRDKLGGDPEIPDIRLHSFGYLYLASTDAQADALRAGYRVQQNCGAATKLMSRDDIASTFPFYNLDDIMLGSHNAIDEGYFDGATMFDWWRRKARHNGVEYIANQVVAIERSATTISSVRLKSGEIVNAGFVVNASGTRGAATARMAGIDLPIEPRRRYTFVFDAARRLDRDLPLTIDPSGVHVRTDGRYYMCGCPPDDDRAVTFDDFALDYSVWEQKVWPAIATRIPAFEQVKLINSWVGHYDYNTFDHNAIIGPHTEVGNFILLNGFSGRGFQQSPAMGRGVSEIITYGGYRTLDLGPLGYGRIARGQPFVEAAII